MATDYFIDMKKTKFVILIIGSFFFTKCGNHDFNKLRELNQVALKFQTLDNFGSFLKSRTQINGVKVCNENFSACNEGEISFDLVLKENNISPDSFLILHEEMIDLGYTGYYKVGDFSLWIQGGAFGDIYGHLVYERQPISIVDTFRLNDYYYIRVGNKLDDNVYYFRGN